MNAAAAYVIEKLGEALAQCEAELQAANAKIEELDKELAALKPDNQEQAPAQ